MPCMLQPLYLAVENAILKMSNHNIIALTITFAENNLVAIAVLFKTLCNILLLPFLQILCKVILLCIIDNTATH